jgi:hypothetical protein
MNARDQVPRLVGPAVTVAAASCMFAPVGAQTFGDRVDFTNVMAAEVRNAQGRVVLGRVFATVTADNRGRAAHERDVPLPQ